MAEGQEIPDQEGDAESQNSQPESPLGHSDAQKEAIKNLADQVDDNKVEAAGKKGGLKAALAARMAALSEASQRIADEIREGSQGRIHESAVKAGLLGRPGKRTFSDHMRRQGHALYMGSERTSAQIALPVYEIAAKVTRFLRDRLQPKTQAPKAPPTTSK